MALFLADMLRFRKKNEKHFSILQASKDLRRVSPTLVSLLIKGKRKITIDRAEELAKLLGLTVNEKQYFKDWIARTSGNQASILELMQNSLEQPPRRKQASNHILTDWINVYVKDAFQLKHVMDKPNEIYRTLAGIASQKRIDKAIEFLLRAGYLRRNLAGKVVEDSPLHVVDQKVSNLKVRQFHKGALKIALQAIDQYSSNHRYANALILPLHESSYKELKELIDEFTERLQKFAETAKDGTGLYQVIINLSPTGDFHE